MGLNGFSDLVEVHQTKLVERIYKDFVGEEPHLDFKGFITCIHDLCSMGRDPLYVYVFNLYNPDYRGIVDPDKCALMLQEILGAPSEDPLVVDSLHSLQQSTNGVPQECDESNFVRLLRKKAMIAKPIMQVQYNLSNKLLGSKYWEAARSRR